MVEEQSTSERMNGIFKYLIKEEVRFHTELFGLSRFFGFPLFIVALVSLGLYGVLELHLGSVTDVLLSIHALFFILALQIGSIAFMADDAAADLLGGRSTLLYSHAYLPVTQQVLIFLFVIKDLLFYVGLFVLPAALSAFAFLPLSITQFVTLLFSLALVFTMGISLSLFLASIGLNSRSQSIIVTIMLISSLALVFIQTSLEITDILVYTAPTPFAKLLATIGTILVVLGFSAYSVRNLELSRDSSEQKLRYSRLMNHLLNKSEIIDNKTASIVSRTLSDVLRSGGGLFKIGFTLAVLFGLTAYLLDVLQQTTAIAPDYALSITAIIGLASYANYVWIFQNDSLEDYQYLPLTRDGVKSAKQYTFHIINTGLLLATAIVASIVFGSVGLGTVGLLVFVVAMSEFYFQFTFTLASFEPMDFLFDTVRFTIFCTVLMILFIPILVIGLFGPLFLSELYLAGSLITASVVFLLLAGLLNKFSD